MSGEVEHKPDEPKPSSRQGRLWSALRQTVSKAGDTAGEAVSKGKQIGGQFAQSAISTAQNTVGKVQRKLGEDYYAILLENPLVLDTLSRSKLLIENDNLLRTVFNVPWTTTLLWGAAAGSMMALQRPAALTVGDFIHYIPGHVKQWDEVNKFMDTAVGVGHRLKFGHSIEYLPQIVEKFGVEGVPAYFMHLLQDFTTIHGIPIAPNAWNVKKTLELTGVSRKVSAGIVSVSFSSVLGALGILILVNEVWKFGENIGKKIKTQNYLKTATAAIQNRDYKAAIANYQRALEVERSPIVLMSLGQVYMQRASNRLRAHQSFVDAVTLLADSHDAMVPYGKAKLSVRGLAGIQALATSDVLADIHPEHWNDHVRDLVNATVFSFSSAASKLVKQSDDLMPDTLVTPSQFSASLNYYLAAKSACYYPFTEERNEIVIRNIQAAVRSLGMMAQYDEMQLRQPANTLRQLWTMELLPPDEVETALATY